MNYTNQNLASIIAYKTKLARALSMNSEVNFTQTFADPFAVF